MHGHNWQLASAQETHTGGMNARANLGQESWLETVLKLKLNLSCSDSKNHEHYIGKPS